MKRERERERETAKGKEKEKEEDEDEEENVEKEKEKEKEEDEEEEVDKEKGKEKEKEKEMIALNDVWFEVAMSSLELFAWSVFEIFCITLASRLGRGGCIHFPSCLDRFSRGVMERGRLGPASWFPGALGRAGDREQFRRGLAPEEFFQGSTRQRTGMV